MTSNTYLGADCGAFVYVCFLPAVVERLRREVVRCRDLENNMIY
jgi:hypothetical protein